MWVNVIFNSIKLVIFAPLNFIDRTVNKISVNNQSLDLDTLKQKLQNSCLNINGIATSYDNLTSSQKLQAFINGPCSPTIIIPGLMASALVAEINCQELQQYEPEVFSNCGWNTCSDDGIWPFDSKPKSEYHLWMPNVFDDLSFIYNDKCFGSIIQLRYNSTATNFREKYVSPRGIKVSWRGNTPQTQKNSECGKQGIINIADNQTVNLLTGKLLGFRGTVELMEAMGYQSGITYQALPYDFRKAIVYNDITPYIKKSLISLKKHTGKKSIILSHSYGSLRTLKALTGFDQEFKDNYISQWIGNGSPFSGVNRLIKTHINSDDEFVEKLNLFDNEFYVGIQFQNQNLNANGASCLFDLYPKDPMSTYKNEPWMQEINERIQYEKNSDYLNKNKQKPLSFFPPKNEQCTHLVNEHDGYCQTGMYDQDQYHLIHINGKEFKYSFEDIKSMLQQFSTIENISDIFQESYQQYLYNMTNPGVPFVNIYGGYNEIETQYEYSLNPNEYTQKGEFYFPNITMKTKGDLTVSTNSVLIAPLKWQWEFENLSEQNQKFKPVRFVELCSSNRLANNVNFDKNENGELYFSETGYNGLQCKCQFTKNGNDCDHASFLNDPYVVQFFVNQFKNYQKSEFNGQEHGFSDQYLHNYVQQCDNLKLE